MKPHVEQILEKKGNVTEKGSEQVSANIKGVKVDVIFSNEEEWPTQLLYLTGPAGSNIGKRKIAKDKGWRLSQHGLFDAQGKRMNIKTEKDVYDKLGIDYRSPEQRGLPKTKPQAYLSKWESKRFVHGPRLLEPGKFRRLYIKPVKWTRKRQYHIINYDQMSHKPRKEGVRVKVGTLKEGVPIRFGKKGRLSERNELALQSFLTPK
jgi:hypothetical protein